MTPSRGHPGEAPSGLRERVVVGIDPGTTVTGYGVVVMPPSGPPTLRECGVIRPTPKAPLPERIREIFEGIAAVLDRHAPSCVSVESVFQGKNARSALVLGHARGAILVAAALRDLEIAEYTPVEIKKAVVGHGSATKDQVGYMVQERLRLRTPPRPSDAADGVAAALCHLVHTSTGGIAAALPHRFVRGAS